MTKDEILTLARAGFTAAQIAALNSVNAAKPEPAKTEPAPAKPAEDPAPAKPAEDPAMSKLLEELTGIKSTIQSSNITNSNMPKTQSADEILASIINPPQKTEGGQVNGC